MGIHLTPQGKYRLQLRQQGLPRVDETFATYDEATARQLELIHARADAKKGDTLKIVWEQYRLSPSFLRKAENTRKREESTAKTVLKHLGDYALDNLTVPVLQNYVDNRTRSKTARGNLVSADTIRLEKQVIRSAFKFASRRGIVKNLPETRALELPPTTPREVRLTVPLGARALSRTFVGADSVRISFNRQIAGGSFGTFEALPARTPSRPK
jgi:hypothetical protein